MLPEHKEAHKAEEHAKVPQSCTVLCKSAANIHVINFSTKANQDFSSPRTQEQPIAVLNSLFTTYHAG
jgi:hypothetical protein